MKPVCVPEVMRGAFRVPFGTPPTEAVRLAQQYRRTKRLLVAAARRRRETP